MADNELAPAVSTTDATAVGPSSAAAVGNSESLVAALYLPLDKESLEIRLVILDPSPIQDAPIRCRLETVALIDRPSYEALSWAWGNENALEHISLNDHMWMAPKNAVTALRYLRYADRSRALWIDALSINPLRSGEALRERENQIQNMRYVYSNAFRVVIWAGVPQLDELLPFIEKYLTGSVSLMYSVVNMGLRAGFLSTQIRRFPWWGRLWILQEAALALDCVIYFGSLVVSFDRLLRELATLQETLERYFDSERDDNAPGVLAVGLTSSTYAPRPQTFLELRRGCNIQAHQYRLLPVRHDKVHVKIATQIETRDAFRQFARYVVQFRYNETSNPVDKLYGLLGLVPDAVGLLLNPRYDEDAASTYRRTTAQIISLSQSLYILSQVHNIGFDATMFTAELPSWVPDWTAKPHIDMEWAQSRYRGQREDIFDASGDAPCIVKMRDDNRTLGLQGLFVDTVSDCLSHEMAPWKTFQGWWDNTQKWRDLIEYDPEAGERIANNYIAGGCREQAFWRTMLYNTTFSWDYPPSQGIPFFSPYRQADNDELWADRQRLSFCSDKVIKSCAAMNIAQLSVMENPQLLAHINRVTARQRFLRTEAGFLGIGNEKIEPGDQVWVLAGGTHPFILRPCPTRPGYHTVVCEAYIDGVMLPGEIKNPYASFHARKEKGNGTRSMPGGIPNVWEQVWLI